MSEHPEVQWALDLLKPDPNHNLGFLKTYLPSFTAGSAGFVTGCLWNVVHKRPYYARFITTHVPWMIGTYYIGLYVQKKMNENREEHDTMLREYIIRHPEFFPEPEHIKYKHVFEEWIPIR